MNHPSPTLSSRLAAWLAPWVLRRLDASWALRLLREGARRLPVASSALGPLAAVLWPPATTTATHPRSSG